MKISSLNVRKFLATPQNFSPSKSLFHTLAQAVYAKDDDDDGREIRYWNTQKSTLEKCCKSVGVHNLGDQPSHFLLILTRKLFFFISLLLSHIEMS